MRPRAIVWFERLTLAAAAIGVGNTIWHRDLVSVRLAAMGSRLTPGTAITIALAVTIIFAAMTLWISRGRNRVVMWIMVVLFVLGLPSTVTTLANGRTLGPWYVSALSIAMQFVGLALLFTPAARAWFRRDDRKPDLADTFA